jgi:hypothetical protein
MYDLLEGPDDLENLAHPDHRRRPHPPRARESCIATDWCTGCPVPVHLSLPMASPGPLAGLISVFGLLAAFVWIAWRFGPMLLRLGGWCSRWAAWACGTQGGYAYCAAFSTLARSHAARGRSGTHGDAAGGPRGSRSGCSPSAWEAEPDPADRAPDHRDSAKQAPLTAPQILRSPEPASPKEPELPITEPRSPITSNHTPQAPPMHPS